MQMTDSYFSITDRNGEDVMYTWVEDDIHSGKLQIKVKSEAGNSCCGKKHLLKTGLFNLILFLV